MKLLQIQDGISVNIDEIEAIEKNTEYTCKVYVGSRIYASNYSYETLLQILKNGESINKDDKLSQLNENVGRLLENSQVWSG